MTCVICAKPAEFLVNDPGANPLEYCNSCLPKHLLSRAAAGHFKRPQAPRKR